MNKSWQDQRKEIMLLCKNISIKYGGDNIVWLREYVDVLLATNKLNYEPLLTALRDVYA